MTRRSRSRLRTRRRRWLAVACAAARRRSRSAAPAPAQPTSARCSRRSTMPARRPARSPPTSQAKQAQMVAAQQQAAAAAAREQQLSGCSPSASSARPSSAPRSSDARRAAGDRAGAAAARPRGARRAPGGDLQERASPTRPSWCSAPTASTTSLTRTDYLQHDRGLRHAPRGAGEAGPRRGAASSSGSVERAEGRARTPTTPASRPPATRSAPCGRGPSPRPPSWPRSAPRGRRPSASCSRTSAAG